MAITLALGALLLATLQPTAAGDARASTTAGATRLTGASATATVSARIIRSSARVGAAFGAPAIGMTPRRTVVSAADGSAVPALVWDFE